MLAHLRHLGAPSAQSSTPSTFFPVIFLFVASSVGTGVLVGLGGLPVGLYLGSFGLFAVFGLLILRAMGLLEDPLDRSAGQAFWTGLVIRLLVASVLHLVLSTSGYKGEFYYDDEARYYQGALASLEPSAFDSTSGLSARGNQAYVFFLASMFGIGGPDVLFARFWMAFLGALVVPFTYRLAENAFENKNVALMAAWSVALFPPLVMHSAVLLRDILITLLVVLIVYLATRPGRGRISWMLVVIAVSILFALRPIAGVALVVVFAATSLISRGSGLRWRLLAILCLSAAVVALSPILFSLDTPSEFGSFLMARYGSEWEGRLSTITDGSGSPVYSLFSRNTLVLGPLIGIRSLLLPNPLVAIRAGGMQTVVDLSSGITWYLALPFIALGLILVFRRMPIRGISLWLLPVAVIGYGWTPVGAGQEPLRARVDVLPLMLAMASYALYEYRSNAAIRQKLRPFMFLMIGGMLAVTAVYGFSVAFSWSITSWRLYAFIGSFLAVLYLGVKAFPPD